MRGQEKGWKEQSGISKASRRCAESCLGFAVVRKQWCLLCESFSFELEVRREAFILGGMSGSVGSLATATSEADSRLTVLDDRLDAEEHAAFLWLRAHQLHGYSHHRVVIGMEVLSPAWNARKKKIADKHSAEVYLHHFVRNHAAMNSLQTLARSLTSTISGPLSNTEVLATIAISLASGRAWVIELPKRDLKSRFVSKTSPAAFAPLNPRFGTKVDFAFIASLEGDQWLRGYVPMKSNVVMSKSGMTVASGFDLGQWYLVDLQRLGLPETLMKKINSFAAPNDFRRMTKAKVAARVAKLGPVPELTKDEADLCDGAVFSKILGDAIAAWDRARAPGISAFIVLPGGWQTVWLSRVYQEGPRARSADAIAFRNAATSGEWQQAIAKLRAYRDYGSRAKQEADLLAKEVPAPIASGAKATR
jgi:hypothetical protein